MPSPRSGHTFTVVGTNGFLFGGLGASSPPGPTADLFILRLGSLEHEWCRLSLEGGPAARWRHSACLIESTQILLFGGFSSSTTRFNDVWVFNTVTMEWWQPVEGASQCLDGNHLAPSWPGCPCPRGAHSATVMGSGPGSSVYVFGGYGGTGYSRRDLDDLHVLDTATWKWSKVATKGKPPEKRSSHQACACETNLYVFGGWSSSKQFDDMHVLDTLTSPPTWSRTNTDMPQPKWNHACCAVMAIPSWKIFVFGGTGGTLSATNALGTVYNDITMLDTGTEKWTAPNITGMLPPARADTVLSYDVKGSKLMIFGGWSNEWYNDCYMLDVGSVVGPPYAIMDIYPKLGPITGSTAVEITGIDFVNTKSVIVRFATKKSYVDVVGTYVSNTKLTCVSPDCSKFSPGTVEVRVALNGDSFTTTFQAFELFAVTDASKCLMYGPGLLSGCAVNEETMFIIQARDENNNVRTSGGDEFTVVVKHLGGGEEGEDIPVHGVHVQDQDDGTYVVMYTAPNPGEYEIEVLFKGSFGGKEGPVRGSNVVCLFEEFVSRDNNTMAGKLVLDSLKADLNFLLEFSRKTNEGITAKVKDETWSNEQSVNSLVSVKEHLNLIAERQVEVELVMDRSSAILSYLRAQGVNIGPMEVQLKKARSTWEASIAELPNVEVKLAPLVKQQASRMRGDIETYEKGVFAYLEEVNNAPYKTFATGAFSAIQLLQAAKEVHSREKNRCSEMLHLANMFDCPRDMARSQDVILSITEMLAHFQELWECAKESTMFIEEAQETRWNDVNPDGMEEAGRDFVAKVKKIPKACKDSDAFLGLDKFVKEFLKTVPLVGALRHPGMRPRHWTELMDATGTTFSMPSETPDMRLREILSLNLHNFGNEVEEITDKAVKESKQEDTIANLETSWSNINFAVSMYKDTDVPLVKISEEDFELLEADQLTLQGMVASRYVFFKDQSTKWQKSLVVVSEVNQIMSEIQRMWSYLEPLFIGSEEVKKELPADAKRFAGIDSQVRQILKKCADLKNVRAAFTQSGLLSKLEALQADQEICKKSLSDFLDGKRRLFPRFYFTSEADLLDILSNGSIPSKIMRHVDKVLLSTKTLELEESPGARPKAKGFISGVGQEDVEFEPFVPLEGKVEIYLQIVLECQRSALRKKLEKSMKNYINFSRTDWLMHKFKGKPTDPAQISILVAAIQYCQEVEMCFDKITKGNASAIEDYNSTQILQLNDLIKLTQTDLSKADRTRVMVMITMDSHSRDVIQTLVREKVTESGCFQWQSQLKQTYTEEGASSSTKCKVCDASFEYGFEYLGNGPRLVITPLTDRIYVTATQALNLKMGCAPAGPAGTGKTESTKDLASALGKCCYVFNCSPEMDYQSLGNIFKGLASSGSWGCFDEFNRLIPEVLSVCSVQFKSVCDGNKQFAQSDLSTHSIVVEGDSIKLDPTNGAFITMNPGYLGRSELPEGLKALFRPMTVMVPDLVLICENMLMAEGFVSAKILASKFYTLYNLLKDLLSKQEHYDWGLRAIKSVLVVAGSMKRSSPDLPEDALLMRALRDTNTPKIVAADEVVFFGLLGDLFPGLDPPRIVDENLGECVAKACELNGLWPDPTFKLKCLQLDELLAIRHCVFTMGPAGAGKSSCWKMLSGGLSVRDPQNRVKVVDLNPKVLPTEDLYGHVSLATREWKDGLLSVIMRDLGQIPDEKPKWILLDGDLDANWIESMNSVMDDNKMLTLASNERIPLKHYMKMIFEIRDLRYATPATVSRAGIIYISTDEGTQWRSLIASWVQSRPEEVYSDESRVLLQELFEKYMPETITFFNKSIDAIVPINDINIVCSLLRLLDGLLTPDVISNSHKLETAFVFACIWAFGSALTTSDDGIEHQKEFSEWWRTTHKTVRLPTRDTIFDYWLDPVNTKFEPWKQAPSFKTIQFDSRTMQMSEITIPTTETASILFWSSILVQNGVPIMLCGPAGTGKTQLVNGLIQEFDAESKLSVTINMNFYSTSLAVMGSLEAPLQKRTGSTFGPPGSASMVYFIDDLNLPEVDKYNTQSAIALVRQHLDYQHWYDPAKFTSKSVLNCQYITAMNPTAGSFVVNPRLQRWFTTFAVGMPSATSLLTIYATFLEGHLVNNTFHGTIITSSNTLIKGALGVHKEVSDTFRKTAANFHYEFNIRHLANVFAGLLVSTPANFDNPEKFCYLWLHESERVYGDRIVDQAGLKKFREIMQAQSKKAFPQFNASKYYLEQNADALIFCHFAGGEGEEGSYNQVKNVEDIRTTLENALGEYNEINALMDLVLFDDAVNHVARITRIISNTAGHAMLVGVGGSGKQSLSRLAAHICGFTTVQITISSTYGVSDLKSDLQAMYRKAGVRQEGVMFLFTDNQITNEKFLVYLNDLLASGNIPDLYTKDEQDAIVNEVVGKVKAAGLSQEPDSCWKWFINEVRKNLHCVLCFSPVGDDFRVRARKFPALVNCTVIDWFHPWPADALMSVGQKFLKDVELGDAGVRAGIEKFMPFSFVTTQKIAAKFLQVEGRHVHSTPKTYLEVLKLYGLLLKKKTDENNTAIARLKTGVTKLNECAEAGTHLESN
jgi:dynein heavy chain